MSQEEETQAEVVPLLGPSLGNRVASLPAHSICHSSHTGLPEFKEKETDSTS